MPVKPSRSIRWASSSGALPRPGTATRLPAAVAANIAEQTECQKLIEAARKVYGPVDVLVNNAALTYYVPIKDYPVNKWLRSWAVNFQAPFILSQLVLADMIPRKSGAIVNIS